MHNISRSSRIINTCSHIEKKLMMSTPKNTETFVDSSDNDYALAAYLILSDLDSTSDDNITKAFKGHQHTSDILDQTQLPKLTAI
jgi:hypothetical protein